MGTDETVQSKKLSLVLACEVCRLGPATGVTVYRTGAKGRDPHWRCSPHLDAIPDKTVADLCQLIENG